jgi:hypothetical protein
MEPSISWMFRTIAFTAVSLFLAFCGIGISHKLGIPTPGTFVVFYSISRGHYYFSGAEALAIQIAIDWVFWFALIWAGYRLLRRLWEESDES